MLSALLNVVSSVKAIYKYICGLKYYAALCQPVLDVRKRKVAAVEMLSLIEAGPDGGNPRNSSRSPRRFLRITQRTVAKNSIAPERSIVENTAVLNKVSALDTDLTQGYCRSRPTRKPDGGGHWE